MKRGGEKTYREKIILDFAKWTVLSALRSGAPIKSRAEVYPLLDKVGFGVVLGGSGTITNAVFDDWHREESLALCTRCPRMQIGWAVKMINVYLKTAAYVGDLGRPGIRGVLHPPIDGGLLAGVAKKFSGELEILNEICCVERIKDISDYTIYQRIIAGCRKAAQRLHWSLIELEQLWLGSATPGILPRDLQKT